MSDTPAPLSGASTPTPHRSFWPWIFIFLAVVALGGATFWFADGPNRYHSSQEMRAGRLALLASDLPKALGHFRAAAILRPTDEAVILQYDQTQSRWVAMVEQQLQKLEPVEAYRAWQKLPATEGELVEPHASRYREIRTRVESGARSVADHYVADARSAWEAGDFAEAYAQLHRAEPFAPLVPELPQRLKEAQAAEVAHVVTAAREATELGDFEGARAALKTVAALGVGNEEYQKMGPAIDAAEVARAMAAAQEALTGERFDEARESLKPVAALAAKNEEFQKLGSAIAEAEVRANLRDAKAAAGEGKLKDATELAAQAAAVGVLADEVAAARGEILQIARAKVSNALAAAISQHDREKIAAALAEGEAFADWKKVPVDDLVQPANVTAFVETLKAFDLGADKQGRYTNRVDIPLVAWAAPNFQDQSGVNEFLRDAYAEWSRALAKQNLPACALFVDDLAGELGAERDEAWRKETLERVPDGIDIEVAVRNPDRDNSGPDKLGVDATAALRAALATKLGAWPKLVDYDEKKPVTVVFYGYYNGFNANDDPTTTEKTVRYQSGTDQVPNPERERVVEEYNDLLERHNNVVRQINDKNSYISSVEDNPNASDWDRSQLVYKRIEVASDRNLVARWRDELSALRRQGDALPGYLDEPVYADEPYEYIQHHYTCEASWGVAAILHGEDVEVAFHTASTQFESVEVTGDARRGVPVKAPPALPVAKLEASLARELVKKAANVDDLVEQLPAMTVQSFVNFFRGKQANPVVLSEQFLGLLYAWERVGRSLESKEDILKSAREVLNLPPAEAGK